MSLIGREGDKNQVRDVRVVSNEWGDLSVCAGHGNAPIDPAGEIRDAILEVMMGNLHNVWDVGIA